jgi:purine-binding chemotaxis protein CheW
MDQVLVFWLGNELYGLHVDHIQEVVEAPALHYIPRAPQHFLGAINFHGSILPVFALDDFLGFEPRQRDHRVVVIPPTICAMALAVRCIRGFVPCDPESLMPVEEERRNNNFIGSVLNREEEMVNVLDLGALIGHLQAQLGGTGGKRGS